MRWTGLTWPLLAFLVALGVRRWLDVVEVRGRSMAPTLLPGDRLVVARLPPRAGDVVLATDQRDPSRELIKRVASIDRFGVTMRGDNPAESTDGRAFGASPQEDVQWRALVRYWPLARAGGLPPRPAIADEGGEAACAFPEALIAG